MAFKKGTSGNAAGRPTGSKDKAQQDVKQAYQQLVEGNLCNIETWLNKVAQDDPGRALDFMLKLSKFIIPEMKSTDFKTDISVNTNSIMRLTPAELKYISDSIEAEC
jgi:hypothetical protein